MTYQTTAIVLKRRNVGEADRIVTILSEDRGKYAVVARGVRKLKSKVAGHIEPTTEVGFYLAEGRTLDVVAGAQTLNQFKGIDRSLDDYAYISKMLELVDKLLPESQPVADVYRLLKEALILIDSGQEARIVCLWFELRLLSVLGLRPELQSCQSCKLAVKEGERMLLLKTGGLVHEDCDRSADGMILESSELKLLRVILSEDPNRLFAVQNLDNYIKKLEEAVMELRLYLGEQRLRSDRFIESV